MLMTGGLAGFQTSKTTKQIGEGGSQIRNITQAAALRQ
jgi:hypothetical protein